MALLCCAAPRFVSTSRQAINARLAERVYVTTFTLACETTDQVLKQSGGATDVCQRLIARALDGLIHSSLPTLLMKCCSIVSGDLLHYSREVEDILLDRLVGAASTSTPRRAA